MATKPSVRPSATPHPTLAEVTERYRTHNERLAERHGESEGASTRNEGRSSPHHPRRRRARLLPEAGLEGAELRLQAQVPIGEVQGEVWSMATACVGVRNGCATRGGHALAGGHRQARAGAGVLGWGKASGSVDELTGPRPTAGASAVRQPLASGGSEELAFCCNRCGCVTDGPGECATCTTPEGDPWGLVPVGGGEPEYVEEAPFANWLESEGVR
jgi:hypothetical protein